MKTNNSKTNANQKSEKKIQTVEMIAYFDNDDNDHYVFKNNFIIEDVISLMDHYWAYSEKFEGFRKQLYNELLKKYLEPNPDSGFYSLIMSYLCSNELIRDGIKKNTNGGTAIIGHINTMDESLSTFEFFHPMRFNDQKRKDYSISSFGASKDSISLKSKEIDLDTEEFSFLIALVAIVKINKTYCCNFSNEEIMKFLNTPKITKAWIAKTLGKFLFYKVIDVILHKRDDDTWLRDIFITDMNQFGFIQTIVCSKQSA